MAVESRLEVDDSEVIIRVQPISSNSTELEMPRYAKAGLWQLETASGTRRSP